VLAAAVLGTGCLANVEIEQVSDPGPAFAEARREAARVQGRPGPAESLQVLVYDRGDGQLVRASVPLWVVEKMGDDETDLDLGDDAEKIRRRIRASDLKNAPLGPLVEVDEEDGDQVLVWLK
jgi:hypothetical protein